MPFSIPSLRDVVQRTRNAFRTEMPGSDAWLWPSNVYVSAKVIGGAVWELFARLAWIDKQRFAMTATGDQLLRHGAEYGLSIKAATPARGNIIVEATAPFTVPAGTQFERTDGSIYTSTFSVDVGQASNMAVVPVVGNAVGKQHNAVAGTPLDTALAGVTAAYVDDDGLGQGTDGESLEQFRERVLARKRNPPHGGAEWDYVAWAKTIPGVTRVFVAGNVYGPGTVAVWPLMDETYAFGIPGATDITAIQNYIDTAKPVTATVFVLAPIPDCVDIIVRGLSVDTQETRESAVAELQALFRNMSRVGTPGNLFTLHTSWLWSAVSNATGERYHKIEMPGEDITFGVGVVPCLRSVRFMP